MAARAWKEEPSHAPGLQNSPIRVRMEAGHRSGKKKQKPPTKGKALSGNFILTGSYMEVEIVSVNITILIHPGNNEHVFCPNSRHVRNCHAAGEFLCSV